MAVVTQLSSKLLLLMMTMSGCLLPSKITRLFVFQVLRLSFELFYLSYSNHYYYCCFLLSVSLLQFFFPDMGHNKSISELILPSSSLFLLLSLPLLLLQSSLYIYLSIKIVIIDVVISLVHNSSFVNMTNYFEEKNLEDLRIQEPIMLFYLQIARI